MAHRSWQTCTQTATTVVGLLISHSLLAQPVSEDFSANPTAAGSSEPSVHPRYVVDARQPKWPDGVINYYYNPVNQPAQISTDQMLNLIQTAGRKWENVCNVRFNYLGTQTAEPDVNATFGTIDRINVIGWQALTGNKSGFDGYVAWWYDGVGPNLVDADMVINSDAGERLAGDQKGLGALITHEMGHMLAIKHSDEQTSVMFATPYNTYAFQNTLRGDDAAACASLYGYSSLSSANRVFNWAEQTFPQFFAPTGINSLDLGGYHYRYFPATNSYLAAKDNALIYLPVGGSLTPLGEVEQYLAPAIAAGF